jgi:two-component system OmpR family response regulator
MRILIVEDDRKLAKLIAQVLEKERYVVDVAYTGDTGLELALHAPPDLAIIDWMLPGCDGLTVCRALRTARVPVAILVLTARGQLEDRVLGLDSGADDYLTKPFVFDELLARLRALSRRFSSVEAIGHELRVGDLVLDVRAHTARRGMHVLDLTATEWRLLEYFMRHAGQLLTRQQLLDAVWSLDTDVQPATVDVYVSYLRRKLHIPQRSDPITTVRGSGYRLMTHDV